MGARPVVWPGWRGAASDQASAVARPTCSPCRRVELTLRALAIRASRVAAFLDERRERGRHVFVPGRASLAPIGLVELAAEGLDGSGGLLGPRVVGRQSALMGLAGEQGLRLRPGRRVRELLGVRRGAGRVRRLPHHAGGQGLPTFSMAALSFDFASPSAAGSAATSACLWRRPVPPTMAAETAGGGVGRALIGSRNPRRGGLGRPGRRCGARC